MGLTIYAKHTKKSISWNYGILHRIRKLALISCGISFDTINIFQTFRDKVKVWEIKEKANITCNDLYRLQLAGYYYPELLFHSDCSGYYSCKNKNNDKFMYTGNIKKLYNELKMLKEHDFDTEECSEGMKQCLNDFYELVKEECESSKYAKIEFI